MNQIILSGIQITISIWEMWMCYEILYMTVLDKKYADKKETIIRWANIFVVGSLLGINRLIAFFSRTMLGLVVILTIMCMYGIKRKKVVLSAGIVFVYFEFIARFGSCCYGGDGLLYAGYCEQYSGKHVLCLVFFRERE